MALPLTLQQLMARPDLPSQRAFIDSTAPETAMVGALGSGKTDALVKKAIMLSWLVPGNEGLIGRASERALIETTKRSFDDLCPPELRAGVEPGTDGTCVKLKTVDPREVSRIWFRHLAETTPGKDHLAGANLGWFAVDQMEEIEEDRWNDLQGRLRRKGVPHLGFGISNARGHDWIWKRWIQPGLDRVERARVPGRIDGRDITVDSLRFRANQYRFAIVTQTAENVFLPDDYITVRVANNPPNWVARFIYCSFEEWSGRIYPEYSLDSVHNLDEFPIPSHWATVAPIDVGGDAPWAIPVMRVDPDGGDVFITREFFRPTVLLREIAGWIKDPGQSGIPSWGRARYICDPENKQVIFELADQHKIFCEAARKGPKIPGILHVASYFHRVPGRIKKIPMQRLYDGGIGDLIVKDAPRLWVFRHRCPNWCREHDGWYWKRDPRNNESTNEPIDRDDHNCDATIYGLRVHPHAQQLPQPDEDIEKLKAVDWMSYKEALYRKNQAEGRLKGPAAKGISEMLGGISTSEEDFRREGGDLPW